MWPGSMETLLVRTLAHHFEAPDASAAKQLSDGYRDKVEKDERQSRREHGKWIRARCHNCRDHNDGDHGPTPGTQEASRRDELPRQFERDEDNWKLEGEAEQGHHQQNEPQVRDRVIDSLEVWSTNRLQEAKGVRQREVGRCRSPDE